MVDALLDVAPDRVRQRRGVARAHRGQRFAVQVRRGVAAIAVDDGAETWPGALIWRGD